MDELSLRGDEPMSTGRTIALWAFICRPQAGSEGGVGWNWAQAYARSGHDVHLVTMPTFREELEEQLSTQTAPGRVTVHFTKADDGVYARGHRGRLRFKLDYLQWQKEALRVSRRAGLDAADLGHHVSLGSILPGTRLDQLGPPLIFGPAGGGHLTGHELQEYLGRSLRESIRTITVKRLSRRLPSARRTASRSHLLLVGNPPSEVLARQLGARHVERMLPEGTDESLLAPEVRRSQNSREQLVLWVGRFLPIKGAPLAVEAFDHVRRAVPTARLVMVGDGVTQAETQRRARALGLSESVEFTGKLDWPSVMRLYDQADVLMLTSIRDSSTATGMEAATRGLPIVALSHSGGGGCDDYPDLGVTKVTAMPVASVAERFGQAVTEVLNDEDYQQRSKVMLEFAADNTWDAKAARLSRWFAQLGSSRVRC
jgi:glycosyltransferase involved in cell wall biosynthesis